MVQNPIKKWLVLLMAVLFGLVIALASVSPVNRIALGTRAQYAAPANAVQHAVMLHLMVHIVMFGAAACVAWFAADFAGSGAASKLLAIVTTLLLGCTTEYLQHAVYRNPIELSDVYTNVLASTGVFVVLALTNLPILRKLLPPDHRGRVRDRATLRPRD